MDESSTLYAVAEDKSVMGEVIADLGTCLGVNILSAGADNLVGMVRYVPKTALKTFSDFTEASRVFRGEGE